MLYDYYCFYRYIVEVVGRDVMSQIDKLNFIPHLFWFLILFFIFYFLIFSYILPLIYQALKVRELFLSFIINESLLYDSFYFINSLWYNVNVLALFVKTFLTAIGLSSSLSIVHTNTLMKSTNQLLK